MTQTKNLLLALTALVIGAFLGAGLTQLDQLVEQPTPVSVTLEAPATEGINRIDAIPADQPAEQAFESLAGTETFTAEQLAQIELAADRVCEGLTAGVPMVEIQAQLTASEGMDDAQARAFANEVAVSRC
jgi:hypothetical protein